MWKICRAATYTNDYEAWIELAAAELAARKFQESILAIQKSVQAGGEAARSILRNDERFRPISATPAFRQLVPAAKTGTFNLPFSTGVTNPQP